MTKLENTTGNKLKLVSGLAVGGASLGYILSKVLSSSHGEKYPVVPFLIGGALVGLFITTGVSSWVIEEKTSGFASASAGVKQYKCVREAMSHGVSAEDARIMCSGSASVQGSSSGVSSKAITSNESPYGTKGEKKSGACGCGA